MNLIQLNRVNKNSTYKNLDNLVEQLKELIQELSTRNLPDYIIEFLNEKIVEINEFEGKDSQLFILTKTNQSKILKFLEKEIKLVPKNYYVQMWLPLGMTAFGLPFGVAFGLLLKNMAFLGIGLPIGIALGSLIGRSKDKEAEKLGNQLNLSIKY